jgi:anti-sigma B factor antagonist
MSSPQFTATAAELGDGIARLTVTGEADLYTAPELKTALTSAIEGGARKVLVDLSRTTFIDSTTLGVLMGGVRRLRPVGGEIALVCTDPNIRKIFEITLLDRIFAIFDTVDAGLDHLRQAETDTDGASRPAA